MRIQRFHSLSQSLKPQNVRQRGPPSSRPSRQRCSRCLSSKKAPWCLYPAYLGSRLGFLFGCQYILDSWQWSASPSYPSSVNCCELPWNFVCRSGCVVKLQVDVPDLLTWMLFMQAVLRVSLLLVPLQPGLAIPASLSLSVTVLCSAF